MIGYCRLPDTARDLGRVFGEHTPLDDARQRGQMPNSILIPIGLYWIIGVTTVFSGILNLTGLDRPGAGVFLISVGVACVVVAVGLHRRWGPAQFAGYLLGLLLVLVSLTSPGVFLVASALAVIIGVALSRPSAREWMSEQ